MPIFIKPGFWVKSRKQLEGYLNIDNLIQSLIPTPTPPVVSLYKSYVAVISQSGTNAPTVDYVLENTLGVNITWNYDGVGRYKTNNISKDINKVSITCSPGNSSPVGTSIFAGGSDEGNGIINFNIIVYANYVGAFVSSVGYNNDLLKSALVEIRVYN